MVWDVAVQMEEDMLDLAFGLTPTYVCLFIVFNIFPPTHTHTHRSRLGCQVVVKKDHENMRVCHFYDASYLFENSLFSFTYVFTHTQTLTLTHTQIELPAATRNFYVDGHVPQPH